jgi:hypothetical protein
MRGGTIENRFTEDKVTTDARLGIGFTVMAGITMDIELHIGRMVSEFRGRMVVDVVEDAIEAFHCVGGGGRLFLGEMSKGFYEDKVDGISIVTKNADCFA